MRGCAATTHAPLVSAPETPDLPPTPHLVPDVMLLEDRESADAYVDGADPHVEAELVEVAMVVKTDAVVQPRFNQSRDTTKCSVRSFQHRSRWGSQTLDPIQVKQGYPGSCAHAQHPFNKQCWSVCNMPPTPPGSIQPQRPLGATLSFLYPLLCGGTSAALSSPW